MDLKIFLSAIVALGSFSTTVTVECSAPFYTELILTNNSPGPFRSSVEVSTDPRQWGLYRFKAFRTSFNLEPVKLHLASSATFLDELIMEAGDSVSLRYSVAEWMGPDQIEASGVIVQWWVDTEIEELTGMKVDYGRAGFIHVPPRRIRWIESTRPCPAAVILH